MTPFELTLTQAAERIRSGEMTAEEYVRALLDRCDAGRSLNAFVHLDPDRLLAEAREADRARRDGRPLGRLHGVPIVVKDSFDIAGTPTTAATPGLADNRPGRTAPVVQRVFDEGALLLGKTNLHELAIGLTSGSDFTGDVRNPRDPLRSPGGSSGGTAAAVAAGMAPAGLGSDTGGSVRIPAAHCGVVGFRPSTGRYPTTGMVPLNRTRDAPGWMARSVADAALLDGIVSGDHTLERAPLEGTRIGLPRASFFGGVDRRIARVIDLEIERLIVLGVTFVETEGPDLTPLAEAREAVMAWEAPRDLGGYLAEVDAGLSFTDLVEAVASPHARVELARVLDAARAPDLEERYRRAVGETIPRLREAFREFMRANRLRAIAFPATPALPPPVGEHETVTVDGREVSIWATQRNSIPAALLGLPGLSLPAGTTAEGWPVGLELDALPGADRNLLAVGIAWEEAGACRLKGPIDPANLRQA